MATSVNAVKKYQAKTYKSVEVMLSIEDHAILKKYCKERGIGMSGYIYDALITYMAAEGIKLTGTATRRPADILDNDQNMQ